MPPLGFHVLLGPDFQVMAQNQCNLEEGGLFLHRSSPGHEDRRHEANSAQASPFSGWRVLPPRPHRSGTQPDLAFPKEAGELSLFSPIAMGVWKPEGDGPHPAVIWCTAAAG